MTQEYRRKTKVGRFGEAVVFEHLSKLGYRCERLGDYFPCFDIKAHKDGQLFMVPVKARNHTRHDGDEKKDCYNLFYPPKKGGDPEAIVKKAEEIAKLHRATRMMWTAVRVNASEQRYDIYWGFVDELPNKKRIPMGPSDLSRHKTLAVDVFDPRIDPRWSNVRRRLVIATEPIADAAINLS